MSQTEERDSWRARGHEIVPHKISRPIQLLAAWLVTLILLEAAFLTAAAKVTVPDWGPGLLLASAVAFVPLFLVALFILLTRFRPQMQDDPYFALSQREKQQQESLHLRRILNFYGLDLTSLAAGRSIDDVPQAGRGEIRGLTSSLEQAVYPAQVQEHMRQTGVDPGALLELARSFMATKEWPQAARYFDSYVRLAPDDWRAHLSAGVAHANSRLTTESNLAALRELSIALALAPVDASSDLRARALSYRAGIYKRLGRLTEAEADLDVADALAETRYAHDDILYNRACIYAMKGLRWKAIEAVRALRDSVQMDAVIYHVGDYFESVNTDGEFIQIVEEAKKRSPRGTIRLDESAARTSPPMNTET